ncbi:unnamed protein product [marine sediment metagenome]|uniref:Uncharacterized protein n=1 Tax=marine sediment metagenome TaxID=412755 RepID=X1EV48_9ZZZZ
MSDDQIEQFLERYSKFVSIVERTPSTAEDEDKEEEGEKIEESYEDL